MNVLAPVVIVLEVGLQDALDEDIRWGQILEASNQSLKALSCICFWEAHHLLLVGRSCRFQLTLHICMVQVVGKALCTELSGNGRHLAVFPYDIAKWHSFQKGLIAVLRDTKPLQKSSEQKVTFAALDVFSRGNRFR